MFGFKPPQRHGHAVVDAIGAMIAGTAKVFIGLGGNFVTAVPDKPITEAAMRRLRLTVRRLDQAQPRAMLFMASRH